MRYIRITAMLLASLLLISSAFGFLSVAADNSGEQSTVKDNPSITSGNAAVAYCIDDDQFLYTDRIDEKVAPAAATKLVACMVAADILKERGLNSAETEVTVTATAIENSGDIADVRVPMMGLKAGNVYSAKDLISATLVAGANDAVASLACDFGEKYLGGGINEFVERMNKKAESIGLTKTNFANPTGLDSPNQYTTPREVAMIAAAFYRYDDLVKLSNVESFLFNGSTTVRNKNYLKSNYYVDGFLNKNAIGLIAGQLDRKGNYCLITASQKEGRTYIFVVMCASGMVVERVDEKTSYYFVDGNAYVDINKLINWTRESFKLLEVATTDSIIGELRVNAGDSDHVMVVPATKVEKLVLDVEGGKLETKLVYDEDVVYKKEFNGNEYDTVDAPLVAGQRVGSVTYSYNGLELVTVDAVAKTNVDTDGIKSVLQTSKDFLFGGVMKTVIYIVVGVIIFWIVFATVMAIVRGVGRARKDKDGGSEPEKKRKPKKPKPKKPKSKDPDPNTATREMR